MLLRTRSLIWLGVVAAALLAPSAASAQGLYLPGGGAAHMSMGGASSATPVDAIGALYWNPAAIGRLGRSEVELGGAFLFPNFYLDSSTPLGLRSGSTKSDSGTGITSNLGVVHQEDGSPWTFGLGLNTIGGGAINFPGDVHNPILAGIGPLGNVQGPIAANLALLQLSPTVAYKLTDRLVLGVGPTVDIAITSFDPAYFGAPDDANGDGVGTFPTGTHSRPFWGGGFRAGLVYSLTDRLDLGFGYTSPQWFENWIYHARNEIGLPRTLSLNVTLPAIYSWGIAYRPTDRWQLSTDLRYVDYKNADLYGTPVRSGGLGWRGVFVAAVGSRYQLTDRMALSAGYVYNDNPIPSVATLFNAQSPLITQHMVTIGTTVNLTDSVSASVGYAYGFHNSITGPIREATGFGVKLSSDVHMLTFSLQFRYGGGSRRRPVTPVEYAGEPAVPVAPPGSASPADAPSRPVNLPGPQLGG
jgi:long-chain fatty acid transport protein